MLRNQLPPASKKVAGFPRLRGSVTCIRNNTFLYENKSKDFRPDCVEIILHSPLAAHLRDIRKKDPDDKCSDAPKSPYDRESYKFSAKPGNTVILKYKMYICGLTGEVVHQQDIAIPYDKDNLDILFDKDFHSCGFRLF
uniref:Uncharacterized protein n=1 Tax=Romanomermis culicivorax TaxID=13658 RepID=A0A915IZ78_ROMCU